MCGRGVCMYSCTTVRISQTDCGLRFYYFRLRFGLGMWLQWLRLEEREHIMSVKVLTRIEVQMCVYTCMC